MHTTTTTAASAILVCLSIIARADWTPLAMQVLSMKSSMAMPALLFLMSLLLVDQVVFVSVQAVVAAPPQSMWMSLKHQRAGHQDNQQ